MGPISFPEKLIPLMILNALAGNPLPVYGDGMQVRRLAVCGGPLPRPILQVLQAGKTGETYNVGGYNEMPNIRIVQVICELLDEFSGPVRMEGPTTSRITYVADRPGA